MLQLYDQRLPQGVIQISPSAQSTSSKNERIKIISLILLIHFTYTNRFSKNIFLVCKDISVCAGDSFRFASCMLSYADYTLGFYNDIFAVSKDRLSVADDRVDNSNDTFAIADEVAGISINMSVVSNEMFPISNDMFVVSNDVFVVSNDMFVRFFLINALFIFLSKINYEFYFITAGQTGIAL